QRPDIRERIEVDMGILRILAKYAEKFNEEAKYYNPKAIVEALEHTLNLELDYHHEISNINRFRSNSEREKYNVIVPEVYSAYSSKEILTMEYIQGFKINDLSAYLDHGISPKEIAKTAMNSFF